MKSNNFKKYSSYLPKPKSQKILNHYWNFIKTHKYDIFNENDYTEVHHCVPRAYLKTKEEINDKENLIRLKGRDHYTAHLLLWLAFKDRSTTIAFSSMNSFKRENDWKISAKLYEQLKCDFSKRMSEIHKGKESHNKGRTYMTNPVTGEHRLVSFADLEKFFMEGWIEKGPEIHEYVKKMISERYKGKNNPSCRHVCTDETRMKRSRSISKLIWINNGVSNKRIKEEDFDYWTDCGYTVGRCKYEVRNPADFRSTNNPVFGSKWVTDGKTNKLIMKDDVDGFLKDNPGFHLGMTDHRNHKNTKRIYKKGCHWYNDGTRNFYLTSEEFDNKSQMTVLVSGRLQFMK